jgi:site-specific DNA recombinase
MGAEDVRDLIESVGDVTKVLSAADPNLKAEVYSDLGLRLTYRPAENLVSVEAAPGAAGRVGGGT